MYCILVMGERHEHEKVLLKQSGKASKTNHWKIPLQAAYMKSSIVTR